jgi:hypothetical protein
MLVLPLETRLMAKRVDLDAMIPRADFATAGDEEFGLELIRDFPLIHLARECPVDRRK